MKLKKLQIDAGSFRFYIEELTLPLYPIMIGATIMIEVAKESLQYIA